MATPAKQTQTAPSIHVQKSDPTRLECQEKEDEACNHDEQSLPFKKQFGLTVVVEGEDEQLDTYAPSTFESRKV